MFLLPQTPGTTGQEAREAAAVAAAAVAKEAKTKAKARTRAKMERRSRGRRGECAALRICSFELAVGAGVISEPFAEIRLVAAATVLARCLG